MRGAFLAFVAASLTLAGVLGSAAFNDGATQARTITVAVAGDAAAYVSVSATSGAHACFVEEDDASGKLAVTFASAGGCSAAGAGTGINAGGGSKYSRYAFHDLLTIRNSGQKTVWVWANASTTSASPNLVEVAKRATSGAMTDADYYATSATGLQLGSTASLYLGVRTNTTLSAGGTLQGSILVEARV